MATTVRQITSCVQKKITRKAGLTLEETKLAKERITGICHCHSSSCEISKIVHALKNSIMRHEETRNFYKYLTDTKVGYEQVRNAWLDIAAPFTKYKPFIAMETNDIKRPNYSKKFNYLRTDCGASDP